MNTILLQPLVANIFLQEGVGEVEGEGAGEDEGQGQGEIKGEGEEGNDYVCALVQYSAVQRQRAVASAMQFYLHTLRGLV